MTNNSKNLVKKALRFENPKRTPVIPIIGAWAGKFFNLPVPKAVKNAELQSEVLIKTLEKFDYDGIFPYMDLTVEAEALGADVKFPNSGMPSVEKHPISDSNDLKSIKIPKIENTRMNVFVRTAEKLVDEVGDNYFVTAYVIGPFSLAGELMGVKNLIKKTVKSPKAVLEVIDFSTDFLKDYVKTYGKTGCDAIMILEPTASSDLISPDYFDKFSTPFIKDINSTIVNEDMIPALHICGDTTPMIENMTQTNTEILSLDTDVSLIQAKTKIGRNNITLMGNVSPTEVMNSGSREDVKRSCKELLGKMKNSGFILSTGCEIPENTPKENIIEMIKSAKKYH